MNIAFDASDLCTARADGTTRYTLELARQFPALAPQHTWHYLAPCDFRSNYSLPTTNYKLKASPWPKYWTQSRMAWEILKLRPDVLLMPIQQLPILRPPKMKTVATIHDLAFHTFPEQTAYKDWLLLHTFTAQVAREADEIIAISRATAQDIAHYYGRTKNVHVVHHGVDHKRFYPAGEDEKAQTWERLNAAFPNIKKPYILYVGQIQPRKNLERLIEAFEQLSDLQLILAGGHGWLNEEIYKRAKESPAAGSIIMPGRIPDELLPALYSHAEVFVLPSLYEGFGMPILEAFASGCPVVTSNVSSMPEVAGAAAELIDPASAESIAAGIRTARRNRAEMIPKGINQAKKFTWEKTARETISVVTGDTIS